MHQEKTVFVNKTSHIRDERSFSMTASSSLSYQAIIIVIV